MKVVPWEGMTMTVAELVRLVEGGAVILTRDGQPLVSVRDISGSDWESTLLAHNPQFMTLIQESRRSYRDSGGISMADPRQEFGWEADAPSFSPDA
jgi:hypothetical protein